MMTSLTSITVIAPPLALQINEDMIWLVFLVLWGLYSLVFGRKKAKDGETPPLVEEDDPDAQRRAREIQEEIRRRIQERARGWQKPAEAPPAPAREERPATPPQMPEPARKQVIQRIPQPAAQQKQGGAEWTEKLAQARRLQKDSEDKVTASLRESGASQVQRVLGVAQESVPGIGYSSRTGSLAEQLRRDPNAVRAAVVLSEIIGKPVSERAPKEW